MPTPTFPHDGQPGAPDPATHLLFVGINDDLDEAVCGATRPHHAGQTPCRVSRCASVAEARALAETTPIDLAVIRHTLEDGSGVDLARDLNRGRRITKTLVVTDHPTVDQTVDALRAGVHDLLDLSAGVRDSIDLVHQRVRVLLNRQARDKHKASRVRKLRTVCRELNEAHQEIDEQVESLCEDLVTAYQELAAQVNDAVQQKTYAPMVEDELDFEILLRKTLEYLIQQAGPSNAAVFLPASLDEYTLGGYVNYDCGKDGAELLLQHLADVAAPRFAEHEGLVTITDQRTMRHWFDDDADWLADSHLLAITCKHDGETLAVITLFRDASQPFDAAIAECLEGIAPLLAAALAKVIRVHHRAMPDAGVDQGDNEWDADTDWDLGIDDPTMF